jgi:hypothetical protein
MTTIEDYLKETEFASTKTIESVWDDFKRSDELRNEIQQKSAIVEDEYNRSLAMQMYAEDPDDVMLGVGRYWANYFEADKEVYHKNKDLTDLTKSLAAREFSLNMLCGNLLENAKKGLSIIYGNPKDWPPGKKIGSQDLSKVILLSRNQSIHIEEAVKDGKFKNPEIQVCFEKLRDEVNPVFGDYLIRDLSLEIVTELGWKTFGNFEADLLTIQ